MRSSNVRLKTNVLCEELIGSSRRSECQATDRDIVKRLSELEFGGLSRAMPLRFSRRLWEEQKGKYFGISNDPVFLL